MAKRHILQKTMIGISSILIIIISIMSSNTISLPHLFAHVLELVGSITLFSSITLALAIHRSYTEKHEQPPGSHNLLNKGPYEICSHPFYLLIIIAQFSIPLSMLSMPGLLTAIILIPLWIYLIKIEEK